MGVRTRYIAKPIKGSSYVKGDSIVTTHLGKAFLVSYSQEEELFKGIEIDSSSVFSFQEQVSNEIPTWPSELSSLSIFDDVKEGRSMINEVRIPLGLEDSPIKKIVQIADLAWEIYNLGDLSSSRDTEEGKAFYKRGMAAYRELEAICYEFLDYFACQGLSANEHES